MPKNLRSRKNINKLNDQLEVLKIKKQNTVQAAMFDNDILIVNCGRFIKYGDVSDSMYDENESS